MLKMAIPNKGALSEDAVRLLGEAGYKCSRSGRELVVSDRVNEIDFVFLRPRDIALYVGNGVLDLGITGRDLRADSGAQVVELMPLGFGRSRFCFAVPKIITSLRSTPQLMTFAWTAASPPRESISCLIIEAAGDGTSVT